jgi:hypothetical protein
MVVTNPDWLRGPTSDQIDAVLPKKAIATRASGAAIVRCRVSAAAKVSDCEILMEAPPGLEFGKAVVRMAQLLPVRPRMFDGKPVDGGVITLAMPFTVSMNPGPPNESPYILNVEPGDAAALVTPTGRSGRPVPGRTVSCPTADEPKRLCALHRFVWAKRPFPPQQNDLLARTDQRVGVSLVECGVAPDKSLGACRVGGEATAASEALLLEHFKGFRAPEKAKDGTPMTSGRVLIEVNWRILTGGPAPDPIAPKPAPG